MEATSINVQGQASEITIEGAEEALAKLTKQARRAMSADERKAADIAEWEQTHLETHPNSRLVPGSTRVATEADKALFAETGRHCHNVVCDIVCLDCGETWTINNSDAFQVRRCATCQAEVSKSRKPKGSVKKDRATLEAEMALAKAILAYAKGENLTAEQANLLAANMVVTDEEANVLRAAIACEQQTAETIAA